MSGPTEGNINIHEAANAWDSAYADAGIRADDPAVTELFTEDAVYSEHPTREPHVGREPIGAYWRWAIGTQADLDLAFGDPVVDGDRAAVEWWAMMIDRGEPRTLPGILMLRFDDQGRCRELREAWFWLEGRHPPPAGWGR